MSGRTLATIETPALVIDLARVRVNVTAMAAAMAEAGVGLRPHFKTSKLIEVARLQREAGAVGFTCATPAEVSALLAAGFEGIFWANSPVGVKAAQAAQFSLRGDVAVGLDSVALADGLQAAAAAAGTRIRFLLEIDTGLGRTGIAAGDAVAVAGELRGFDRLDLIGVYTHEGQLAGLTGPREELKAAGLAAGQRLVDAAAELRAAGFNVERVSVGSTPGWDSAPLVRGITEARPGTYVFFDANQLRLGSCEIDQCAVTVLASVVSTPRDGAAVVDAGVKAMSSDRSNRGNTLGLPLTAARQLEPGLEFGVAYEEHGLLSGPLASALAVGQRMQILPNHACGVTNMWSRVYVVDGEEVVADWAQVARH
jgi:D-serine deaminase-like pyridoxal phosphate-dependent protein